MSLGYAIAAFIPGTLSSLWFAKRRLDKARMAKDSIAVASNTCIADAQMLKAGESVIEIAKESKSGVARGIIALDEAIKEGSKASKVLGTAGKVGEVAVNNINPLITGFSIYQVARAENKPKEGVEQFFLLGGMFAGEGAYKALVGMPKTKRVNGKLVVTTVEGLYKKNPFLKAQVGAIKDACAASKALKHLPFALKGAGLVAASVASSCAAHKFIGKPVAEKIFGKDEVKEEGGNYIPFTIKDTSAETQYRCAV